jgi:hypothetical protein
MAEPVNPVASPADVFPSVYSNLLSVKVSFGDVAILFAHEVPPAGVLTVPAGSPVLQTGAQPDIMVNMSYVTAKVLSENLALLIQEYEAKFGPIKIPTAGRPKAEQMRQMVANLLSQGSVT